MNGYWTCKFNKLSCDQRVLVFQNLYHAKINAEDPAIGTFSGVAFGDLAVRCRELNISELELGHIPKSMVREFTSGKCVMVKLASRPGFAMIQISEFLKEPPAHPGYEPPAQPQS